MRDIRKDLRERLASVLGRYADEITEYDRKRTDLEISSKTLTALAGERAALEQLLAVEDARWNWRADAGSKAGNSRAFECLLGSEGSGPRSYRKGRFAS
jgi:hypothetical protein